MTHKQNIALAREALKGFWMSQGDIDVGTGISVPPSRNSAAKSLGHYAASTHESRLRTLNSQSALAGTVARMLIENMTVLALSAGVEHTTAGVNGYFKRVREDMGNALLDSITKHEV